MVAADPYDVVPYPSAALEQTHPDRLASIGRLYGLETAAPERCRYLELGCGCGINLIAMAALLPGSQFIGIDLAQEPILQAQRDAAELGLANVVFRQGDITTLATTDDLGLFDYIVAHGVYSWVPAVVRAALLALCRDHLGPAGIAYISYNTFPGGHVRQMVREMMRHHVRGITAPAERLEQGRALIKFIIDSKGGPDLYAPLLQPELEHLDSSSDGLIYHDDFADTNQPFYFHEFMGQAHAHELQFVAEAALLEMQDLSFAPEARATLQQMDDLLEREQYIDFLKCRRFRQTLLCHSARTLERSHSPLRAVRSMMIASNAQQREPAPGPGQGSGSGTRSWTFLRAPKAVLTTSSPQVERLLSELDAVWPATVTFDEILARLHARGHTSLTSEVLAPLLVELGAFGIVDLRLSAGSGAAQVGARPCVHRLARWQATRGPDVTTLTHVMVKLDGGLVRQLVLLCDGTRTFEELISTLTTLVQEGRLAAPPRLDITDAAAVGAALRTSVPPALSGLRRLALLSA